MTSEQFAYWLQGFVELTGGVPPTKEQWDLMVAHLGTVFNKVTPKLNEIKVPKVVPAMKLPIVTPVLPVATPVEPSPPFNEIMERYRKAQEQRQLPPSSPVFPTYQPTWVLPDAPNLGTFIC